MRIGVHDNYLLKFSGALKTYWESKGHTVLFEPGYNSDLIETCDRVFFEAADSSTHLASQQRPYKKGKVFVRIIDIDAHANGPAGIQPGYFDGVIYIAEHIQRMCEERFKNLEGTPSRLIPMGLDLDKFTYRKKERGKKIALISTRLSPEKGVDRALMMFRELRKQSNQWELHIVGRMLENSVWEMHMNHLLEGMSGVHMHGNLPEGPGAINNFLEDKDYILSYSHKEAFGFSIAEGMAKGLKPVIYNFKGAESIWPKDNLFRNEHEAVQMFNSPVYTPKLYRSYIEKNYPLDKHLEEVSNFMEIPHEA